MSEPRSGGPIWMGQVFSAAAVAFAIFIFVVQTQRLTTNIVLWRQLQGTQNEISAGRSESERLERRKIYVQTNEYVESVARHDMKLSRTGEVSVIAVPLHMPRRPPLLLRAIDLTAPLRACIITNALRGGAVAARWAHNPKVGSSNLPPAT